MNNLTDSLKNKQENQPDQEMALGCTTDRALMFTQVISHVESTLCFISLCVSCLIELIHEAIHHRMVKHLRGMELG